MAVTERRRHELANRAHEVLGPDQGDTLMELLPPVGWGDVVTTQALDDKLAVLTAHMDARFSEVDARFAQVDARFEGVRADLHEEFRHFQFRLLTAMGVLFGASTAVISTVVAVLG